jgi:G3E family GTPase
VEAQVKNADLALLNKCDLVEKKQAILLQNAIASINPELTVLLTEFGAVDWAEYKLALSGWGSGKRDWLLEGKGAPPGLVDLIPEHEAGAHPHKVEEGKDALGYESFGRLYGDGIFSTGALEDFFGRLRSPDGGMGEVVRAKGIFKIEGGWKLMELASGNFSSQPIGEFTENRISIIGKKLNRERLEIELNGCIVPLTS